MPTPTVTVTVLVLGLSPRAALLSHEGDEQWVPQSLLTTAPWELQGFVGGGEVEVEVADWKAAELGWGEC